MTWRTAFLSRACCCTTSLVHFAALFLWLTLTACASLGTRRDIAELARFCRVEGREHAPTLRGAPVYVVALTSPGERVINYEVVEESGNWGLHLPPGRFRIWVFQDRNGNLRRDVGEVLSSSAPLTLQAGERTAPALAGAVTPPESPRINLAPSAQNPRLASFRSELGSVASLDEPRFSHEAADAGHWTPLEHWQETRALGLYFTEPYDPKRTPVLFVHGLLGSPQDFTQLVAALDRSAYQAWFLAYPSGFPLSSIAEYLADSLTILQARLGASRVAIVAHSVGGLVSKAALSAVPDGLSVPTFITLATPWAGDDWAAAGVRYFPAAVLSWRDLSPKSPFLESVLNEPLPADTRHHLLFGYDGVESGDGTIPLRSQLEQRAQRAAFRLQGVSATHDGILADPFVAGIVKHALLADAEIEHAPTTPARSLALTKSPHALHASR